MRALHRPFAFYRLTASKSTHSWKARADAPDDRSPPHVLHRPRASGIRVRASVGTNAARLPTGETVRRWQINYGRFRENVRDLFHGEDAEVRVTLVRPPPPAATSDIPGATSCSSRARHHEHSSGFLLVGRGVQCVPSDGQSGGRNWCLTLEGQGTLQGS